MVTTPVLFSVKRQLVEFLQMNVFAYFSEQNKTSSLLRNVNCNFF